MNRLSKKEWKELADVRRLDKLKSKSELHDSVTRLLRQEFGYDNVKEFSPMRAGNSVTFRDIWIPSLFFCVKFYESDESKDWYADKFRVFRAVFIHKTANLDDSMKYIQEAIFGQIEYLAERDLL